MSGGNNLYPDDDFDRILKKYDVSNVNKPNLTPGFGQNSSSHSSNQVQGSSSNYSRHSSVEQLNNYGVTRNDGSTSKSSVSSQKIDIFSYFDPPEQQNVSYGENNSRSQTSSSQSNRQPSQSYHSSSSRPIPHHMSPQTSGQPSQSSKKSDFFMPGQQKKKNKPKTSGGGFFGSFSNISDISNYDYLLTDDPLPSQPQQQQQKNKSYEHVVKGDYYMPKPREEVEPDEEIVAEQRRKESIRHQQEMKRRMKKQKKFRVTPIRNIFGRRLEDALIRPLDDPYDEADEFTCSWLPFPIFRIIRHLEDPKRLRMKGIYRTSGSVEKLQELKKIFDRGQNPDLSLYSVATCASCLKDYFKSLPNPLIPFDIYDSFMDASKIERERFRVGEMRLCVRQLPRINQTILKILVEHLRKVVEYKRENCMDYGNLAIVFAPTLLKSNRESGMITLKHTPDRIKIVNHLIKDYHVVFF